MIKPRPGQEHFIADIDVSDAHTVDAVIAEIAPRSVWGEAWCYLRRRPLFWVSATFILLAVIVAIAPGLFTHTDPRFCELSHSLEGPRAGHPFGFNRQGCDIYARTLYGARTSVLVGVLTTLLVVFIGVTIGALAGYFGGIIDTLLSRIVDIFYAVPLVLAAIVVMQVFKEHRTIITVVIALSIFGWTHIARITRGVVLATKNEEFVTAARAVGATHSKILLSHIVPNAAAPIIVYATVVLGTVIVAEATLSFLGIGLPSSAISWGADISAAQSSLRSQPMILFYPAAFLGLTVLSFIMMGDVVQDAFDPQSRQK
ncbi:ABC transporter permease [Corynebacterium kutscheri]|nr:ABC transporter permease [Corynebacterium kutscheri]